MANDTWCSRMTGFGSATGRSITYETTGEVADSDPSSVLAPPRIDTGTSALSDVVGVDSDSL